MVKKSIQMINLFVSNFHLLTQGGKLKSVSFKIYFKLKPNSALYKIGNQKPGETGIKEK